MAYLYHVCCMLSSCQVREALCTGAVDSRHASLHAIGTVVAHAGFAACSRRGNAMPCHAVIQLTAPIHATCCSTMTGRWCLHASVLSMSCRSIAHTAVELMMLSFGVRACTHCHALNSVARTDTTMCCHTAVQINRSSCACMPHRC